MTLRPRVHRGPRPLLLCTLCLVATLLGWPRPTLAAPQTLSGPLARGGQVEPAARSDNDGHSLRPGYQLSPDRADALYLANQARADAVELFRVPVAGGPSVRLNGPLAPGGNVVEFALSPDGRYVVYLADQEADERFELFAVPLAGGVPVALSGLLVVGGDVRDFRLSLDGRFALFRADRNDDEQIDLFAVALSGGPARRLNQRSSPLGDVQPDYRVTPDGSRALFRANPNDATTFDLFAAPLAGGTQARLTRATTGQPGGPSVLDFALSPDGLSAALRVRDPDGSINLFLAPTDGSDRFFQPLTALDSGRTVAAPPAGSLPPGERPPGPDLPYAFTPDGSRVVLIADLIPDVYQLHAVATAPSGDLAPPLLTLSPTVTGPRDVLDFRLSPDGSRAVFRADIVDDVFELISVRVADGENTVFLFPAAQPEADVGPYAISPDGTRVVYSGGFGSGGTEQLRSTSLDSSAGTVVLSASLPPAAAVLEFAITDAQQAVFRAEQEAGGPVALFTTLLAGGELTRLSQPLVSGGTVRDFVLDQDGLVLFRADATANEVVNLFAVPSQGGTVTALTDLAAISGDVATFALTPDGATAIYLADAEQDERFELFAVPLAGGSPRKLNAPLTPGGDVLSFQISPDGDRVVYLADQERDGMVELFSVPPAGGEVVKLNGPLIAGGDVQRFLIAPSGGRVGYLADQELAGTPQLYSAPLAGGAASTRLSELAPARRFFEFALSSDGARAVYRAEQGRPGVAELFSVPLAGGSSTALNPPLPEGASVAAFVLSPDGRRVVYAADQAVAGRTELFSVAVAGSNPVRISPSLTEGGDVVIGPGCVGRHSQGFNLNPAPLAPFLVSPDSSRALFCADADVDEVPELFSAPLDDSAPATKLNTPPGSGGGVVEYQLSPNGSTAVFSARTLTNATATLRLFSAPLAGSAAPTVLATLAASADDPARFAVSPDGATVVYTSNGALFAVPIRGGESSRRSLPDDGQVGTFAISPNSQRLFYLAGPRLMATVLVGNAVPASLTGPLPAGSSVRPDLRLTPTGDVLFRADLETPGVVALYLARFGGRPGIYLPFIGRPPEPGQFPWPGR